MKKIISSMVCIVSLTSALNMFAMQGGNASRIQDLLAKGTTEKTIDDFAKVSGKLKDKLGVTDADYKAWVTAGRPGAGAVAGGGTTGGVTTSGTGTGGVTTSGTVTPAVTPATGGGDPIETALVAVETAMNTLGSTAQTTKVVDSARKQNIMARVQTAANKARQTAGV